MARRPQKILGHYKLRAKSTELRVKMTIEMSSRLRKLLKQNMVLWKTAGTVRLSCPNCAARWVG